MPENLIAIFQQRLPLYNSRQAIRLSHFQTPAPLTIDDYAGHLLITDYAPTPTPNLPQIAAQALEALARLGQPAHSVSARRRPDNLSHEQQHIDPAPILLAGQAPPDRWTITEFGLTYEVSFTQAGFSTGLFPDMALGRQWVRQNAAGRRVLNLFSFTGGFSIAAAAGGAISVVEVDTAGKWLGWSQANQTHNAIPSDIIRQRRNDAVAFLARAKPDEYDLIICDPPSFAQPKRGKRFTIREGYRDMAKHFTRALSPQGILLACCNHAQTTPKQFRHWLPKNLTVTHWLPPPPDFPKNHPLKVAISHKR